MTRAAGDPDSIRQLARHLGEASSEMERTAQKLVAALKRTDWNDPVRQRFEQDLNDLVRTLRTFKPKADDAQRHLLQKASQLDGYLRS